MSGTDPAAVFDRDDKADRPVVPRRVTRLSMPYSGDWAEKLAPLPPQMELSEDAERRINRCRKWFIHKRPADVPRCDHLDQAGPALRGLICVIHPKGGIKCAECLCRHRMTKHKATTCMFLMCDEPPATTLIVASWCASVSMIDLRRVGLVGWDLCVRHMRPLSWSPRASSG
ncbi:MAG: hypothetical protein JO337_04755 [Acidimicrobiales bacterium]|nr:hypothetical protein [Acidimicrobiales bacterium]